MAPSILLCGLPADDPSIPEYVDRAQIKAGIAKVIADATEAGYDIHGLFVGADKSVEALNEEMKKRHYDAVIIGFGERCLPQYTVHFETLVNTIATISPGTKFGFNSTPDDTLDAIKRAAPL